MSIRPPNRRMTRDALARQAVLRWYSAAFDHFATDEQHFAGEGRWAEAEGAHVYAVMALRAYRLEMDDPPPPMWAEA